MSYAVAKQTGNVYEASETDIDELQYEIYGFNSPGVDSLSKLQSMVGAWADRKGWHRRPDEIAEWVALLHTEVSEMYEEHRNGRTHDEIYFVADSKGILKPEGILVEEADAVIRILHHFDKCQVSLAKVILLKMAYNETREHRHGGKRA